MTNNDGMESVARTKHLERIGYGVGVLAVAGALAVILDKAVKLLTPYAKEVALVAMVVLLLGIAYGLGALVQDVREIGRET